MLKLKMGFLMLMMISLSSLATAQSGPGCTPLPPRDPSINCNWTEAQGIEVGQRLGSSETYYKENWNVYYATITQFTCYEYTYGVSVGYEQTRIVPVYTGGGINSCILDPDCIIIEYGDDDKE